MQAVLQKLDLIGWVGYGVGLSLSIFGVRKESWKIGAISLILISIYYWQKPSFDLLNLQYKNREKINISLLIAFAIFIFLFRFSGLAYLCLGLNFFLYGCLSLKGQRIYLGQQWRLEDRTCYSQSSNSIKYWLWTSGFLLMGLILMIAPLAQNRWTRM